MSKVKMAAVGLAVAEISAAGLGIAFASTPAQSKAPVTAPAEAGNVDNQSEGNN